SESVSDEEKALLSRLAPAVKERMKVLSDVVPLSAFLFKDEPCTDRSQYIAKGMSEESAKEAFRRGSEIVLANEKAGKPFAETESDIKALAEKMGVKINGIFQPIRVAITASTVSLPLHDSISLLGLEETERRISRAIEFFC
ncbi:MAG: glutamate--tRNA ligase, partial [Bullifex sp.]